MTSIVEHQRASGCFREKGREPDRQVEQGVLAKTRQMQKWWKYRWRGRPSPPSSRGQREPGQSRGTSSTWSPTIHHGEDGHEIESHRPGWPCPGRPRDPWRWVPFLLLWKGGIQHDSIFYSRSLLFQISQSWQVNCHSKYIGSQFHFQLNSLLANIFFYQVQFQSETNLRKLRCHFSFTPSVMCPCRTLILALISFKNLEYQRATIWHTYIGYPPPKNALTQLNSLHHIKLPNKLFKALMMVKWTRI